LHRSFPLRLNHFLALDQPMALPAVSQAFGGVGRYVNAPNLASVLNSGGRVHRVSKQLESSSFASQDPGSDWSRMNPNAERQLRRVGTVRDLELLRQYEGSGEDVLCETHHDHGMILSRIRDPGGRDVAVADRFDLEHPSRLCDVVEAREDAFQEGEDLRRLADA